MDELLQNIQDYTDEIASTIRRAIWVQIMTGNTLEDELEDDNDLHDGKTLEQIIDEQPTVEPKTGRWIDKINRWLDPDIDSELALERIREIMYKMEDENDTDRHGDAD